MFLHWGESGGFELSLLAGSAAVDGEDNSLPILNSLLLPYEKFAEFESDVAHARAPTIRQRGALQQHV